MGQPKVYLAGPAVFRPDPGAIGRHLKALCEREGLIGLWPLDNDASGATPRAQAQAIFEGNVRMIGDANAVVADISPFRGPHMDCGTAWEIGAAAALGKPVFAYTRDHAPAGGTPAPRPMIARIASRAGRDGPRDANDDLVEDFGLAENLMIGCSVTSVALSPEDAIRACAAALRQRR